MGQIWGSKRQDHGKLSVSHGTEGEHLLFPMVHWYMPMGQMRCRKCQAHGQHSVSYGPLEHAHGTHVMQERSGPWATHGVPWDKG
jgi:hypothetical protein